MTQLQGMYCIGILVLLLVSTTSALVTSGCHSLWVQLVSWTGDGEDWEGDDCDTWLTGIDCDPVFYICMDKKTPQDGSAANRWSGTSMSSCDYSGGVLRTREYNSDNSVIFGTGLGYGLSNPLKYESITKSWQKARLYIRIMDDDLDIDGIEEDDLIDEHLFDLNGRDLDGTGDRWAYSFSQSVIPHDWVEKEVQGTHYSGSESRIMIKYKAVCCQDYYNYDCSVFCIAQNTVGNGFYTCDPMTGDKVCRDGYFNPATDPPCVTRIDPCSSHECFNGGTHHTKEDQTCGCLCRAGFRGDQCESTINYCSSSPCQNGGICNNESPGYSCTCLAFYTGEICELTLCQTDDLECKNGGVCVEEIEGCQCATPFRGDDCSKCHCSSHGNCDVQAGKCTCQPGWTGDTCDVDICQIKTCLYGGSCEAGECMCKEWYTGNVCESPFTACDSSPCENGGTCNLLNSGYKCECKVLYFGEHCESEVEEPSPTGNPSPVGQDKEGVPMYGYIIIAVAAVLVVIIIVMAILWRRDRKRKQSNLAVPVTCITDQNRANNEAEGIFTVPMNVNDSDGQRAEDNYYEEPLPRRNVGEMPSGKSQCTRKTKMDTGSVRPTCEPQNHHLTIMTLSTQLKTFKSIYWTMVLHKFK